jgi:hypothetical protein
LVNYFRQKDHNVRIQRLQNGDDFDVFHRQYPGAAIVTGKELLRQLNLCECCGYELGFDGEGRLVTFECTNCSGIICETCEGGLSQLCKRCETNPHRVNACTVHYYLPATGTFNCAHCSALVFTCDDRDCDEQYRTCVACCRQFCPSHCNPCEFCEELFCHSCGNYDFTGFQDWTESGHPIFIPNRTYCPECHARAEAED